MDPHTNNLQIHAFSAFRRKAQPESLACQMLAQLQAFGQQLVHSPRPIPYVHPLSPEFQHQVTLMLASLIHSLQRSLSISQASCLSCPPGSTLSIKEIPIQLFKNITLLLQEGVFRIDSQSEAQLTFSILLQADLAELFLRFIGNLTIVGVDGLLAGLLEPNYRKMFAANLFGVYNRGSMLPMSRASFESNLKNVLTMIGKVFTQQPNLLTRNLKSSKKSKLTNEIITNSVKNICNYKNEQYLTEETSRVSSILFNSAPSLTRDEFTTRLESLLAAPRDAYSSMLYTMFLYVDLFRVEMCMIQDPQFLSNIQKNTEPSSTTNFYTQEMQKLLKKCPYNGDECCNCKKCQCVRRNRESAKLSQEKKRNAVEQLDPMKRRIEELESRNRQLEEENRILRGLVSELKNSEAFKATFNSTIETVSKVLHD